MSDTKKAIWSVLVEYCNNHGTYCKVCPQHTCGECDLIDKIDAAVAKAVQSS